MRVGILQFAPERLATEANIDRMLDLLERERDALIVTPELATSGYLFRNKEELRSVALTPDSYQLDPLYKTLKTNRLLVALGLPENKEGILYNSLLLAGPEGVITLYRKIHLFDREKSVFHPGQAPPPVLEVRGTKLGMMICWDWFFPETARYLARKGARVILHAANLVLPWCLDSMRTRSLENRVFAVTANRTGREEVPGKSLVFKGGSQVTDPDGKRILTASDEDGAVVKTVEIDPRRAEKKDVTPNNSGPWEVRLDLLT
ncbi:MAG: nitrilase-related carbon-nitrogen hydrolase [Planctomycetota bacterium]|jgi:predicted amidohydrolase